MTLTNTTTYFKLFFALIAFTNFVSCIPDDSNNENVITETEAEAFARNQEEIEVYIEANDLEAVRTDSGLYYVLKTEGTGASPSSSSNVTVTYKGYLLDGSVFDQSTREFNLGGVISGFSEGIQLMKEGGSATLLLPARLAYGIYGSGSIPPYTVIAFDVELIAAE